MFLLDYHFVPTYGFGVADLLGVGLPEAPPDFDAFWQSTFEQNTDVDLNLHVEPVASADNRYNLSIATFDTLGGYRTGAWVVYRSPVTSRPGS